MTYGEILRVAAEQSAIDLGCEPRDLLCGENRVVLSRCDSRAHRYLQLPFFFQLVTYGGGVVASVSEKMAGFARSYLEKYGTWRCFETPAIHELDRELARHGHRTCFMAQYYLPSPELPEPPDCGFETRVMLPPEFAEYYLPEFGNAICKSHSERDVIAVGAFDGGRLVGLAGASDDCEKMWQIGVDVLPEYRRRNIASALTVSLAREIFDRGKVPFYCAAWSNVPSARNAARSGFRPAWVELTAKSDEFIKSLT